MILNLKDIHKYTMKETNSEDIVITIYDDYTVLTTKENLESFKNNDIIKNYKFTLSTFIEDVWSDGTYCFNERLVEILEENLKVSKFEIINDDEVRFSIIDIRKSESVDIQIKAY